MGIKRATGLERRRHLRLKDNIFLFCRLDSSPPEEFKAISSDISEGGLCFETDIHTPAQKEINLEIYQPATCDKRSFFSTPCLAKVIWIEKIEKDNFMHGENEYKTGIEFLEIKEEDRQRIAKYVKENVSEKK